MVVNLKTLDMSIALLRSLTSGVGQGPRHAKRKTLSVFCWLDPSLSWDCSPLKEGVARLGMLETVWTPANNSVSRAFDPLEGRCLVLGLGLGVGQSLRLG